MEVLDRIFTEARRDPARLVLAEGADERVSAAAVEAAGRGIARLTLLCSRESARGLRTVHREHSGIDIIVPAESSRFGEYAERYEKLRSHKGVSRNDAIRAMMDPLGFAAMMVRCNDADGTIAGAVATTADTIRAALQIIGTEPGVRQVSSFFLMIPANEAVFGNAVLFADCALSVNPGPEELAEIGVATANWTQPMLGEAPNVAFLSFSTKGSSMHEQARVVAEAVSIARAARPDAAIEGEIQFDAAIDPVVRQRKAPDSKVQGLPNVFVFPNLSAANIGYKIAERIGGMTAVGPVLQGLSRPANDLSRGCATEDILNLIAITSVQARRGLSPSA